MNMLRGSPTRSAGVTLLEIMVVVVIIAVLISISVVSLGDNSARVLSEEARRLQTLVRLALDEATLQGREVGIAIDEESYQFQVYDEQLRSWQPLDRERIFRPRTMPSGVRMQLYLDDQQLALPVEESEIDEDADNPTPPLPTPQLLLLSSGEMTPFELRFESETTDMEITIAGHPNGGLEQSVVRD
ncbi:MAG: type II secretion system minor pseudopilin GspH [Gammaproteobacteria bacterium]|nr:type II secretion system minor pseudopilin GspH [Gammaproteobacteria bacterium]